MSQTPPVLVLFALEGEGAPLRQALANAARESVAGLDFERGSIGPTPVVLACTGIGKVGAAHAMAAAAAHYRPRAAVVVGVAGALDSSLGAGDWVVGRELLQHDLGVRSLRRATADPSLAAVLAGAAARQPETSRVRQGTLLTGDRACMSLRRRLWLRFAFHGARPLAVDMESAAAAAVANRAGIPLGVLRIVTDGAGPLAAVEFRRNFESLAPRPARAVLEWLRAEGR